MRKMIFLLILLSSLVVGQALITAAQPGAAALAAVTDGNIWLYSFGGGAQQVTTTGGYDAPVWNADGTLLAFTGPSPAGSGRTLFVSDLTDRPLTQLADGLSPLFPAGFSPDGSQLVYAVPGAQGSSLVEVYTFRPQAGAAPVFIGSFQYDGNCSAGAGLPQPNEQRLNVDSRDRFGASGHDGVLALTTFGLLHDSGCLALDVRLINLQNGQDVTLFDSADAVFVSPERARVIVRQGGSLSFVNSERGPYTQIQPAAVPDQVGFGLPGSNEIYYSTRTMSGATLLPAGMADLIGSVFFQMPVDYAVSIHRFSLRTGMDDVLYTASAYGIGNLALTADGGTLVFSQTPNPDAWVQALADKTLTLADLSNGGAARFAQTDVFALSLADRSVVKLGSNWDQMALNPSASVPGTLAPSAVWTPIPTLPIPPTPTYPPTLTPLPPGATAAPTVVPGTALGVGVHATINPEFTALNVRRQPSTGSRVVEILRGGEEVFIIDGPTADAEGYTWWHVTLPSGADGWVAENINGLQTMQR